ncbi:hypothetical protein K502DRAFT_353379 [Neoconidiobolus thromboides FSU 785]|nr:hypothetical protein K502DRAFT_353379 [Neoconidiobolus thromboides FSU 785]
MVFMAISELYCPSIFQSRVLSLKLNKGGYLVVGNKLYYLGNKVYIVNVQVNGKDNNKAFHLNLKKGFKLSNNEAEWNETNIVNPPKTMNTPKLFYTNDSNNIISIYENDGDKSLVFTYLNIKDNKRYDEYSIKDLFKE